MEKKSRTQKKTKSKQQKQKPEPQTFFGMPMNWDLKNWHSAMWNKNDDDLFPPKSFGIGWTVNFHAVLRRLHVIREKQDQ